MARWTGTWLTGAASATDPGAQQAVAFRGQGLGLPESGPGSVAPTGARIGAFVVDIVLSTLIGGLLGVWVHQPTPVQRNLAGTVAFLVMTVISLALTARTPGMALLGLRVLPLQGSPAALGLWSATVRTLMLATLVLAVVTDRDGRGLHDRVAGTVVVRAVKP